jgi:methylmalonyl-CoA/ethylmalonyl-CoA epimerase
MTESHEEPQLHHVVFAIAPERHDTAARLFTELGFSLDSVDLAELGLRVSLDWNRGIELMSPLPESTATVAGFVNEFLDKNGDGIYTVVIRVPGAPAAEAVAERYGSITRFQQSFSGDGSYLHEVDSSVLGLPLTFLSTNLP